MTAMPIFGASPSDRLIGKVKLGVGHQASTDRDHSPLAAGEAPDRCLHELPQRLENAEHAFLALLAGPPGLGRERTGIEMLFDSKSLKDLVALRHDGQSLADDLMGVAPRPLAAGAPDLLAVEKDGTALPAGKSGDGVKERRLSVTVQSDDADPLAGMDDEIEVVNNPQRAVTGGKTLDFQNLGHRCAQCVSK